LSYNVLAMVLLLRIISGRLHISGGDFVQRCEKYSTAMIMITARA
jgi:hypothetical protein